MQINPQKTAVGIIIFAIILFVAGSAYTIYKTNKDSYVAGAPPEELSKKTIVADVPYNQIKPPALNPEDAFIIGSSTSTYGIVFYGDYTNEQSNQLLTELLPALAPYEDLIRLNYRYLPDTTEDGDNGYEAAVASECSRLFGVNWILHELFIRTKAEDVTKSYIRRSIQDATLQPEIIATCQYNTSMREQVAESINTAKSDGIDKAPFIFIGTQAIPASEATKDNVIKALQTYIRN